MSSVVITVGHSGFQTEKAAFFIDNDAFPRINNAYVWRDRLKKKRGVSLLGRLTRALTALSIGNSGASPWSFNIFSLIPVGSIPEANGQLVPGSITINLGTLIFIDNGLGVLIQKGIISGATNANPCQITSTNHNLLTGSVITITGVLGMTQLNGNTYVITVVDANNFTLNGIDSTAYGTYTSGGIWTSVNANNFGTINYQSGAVTITDTLGAGQASTISLSYTPNLPVMGDRQFNQNFTGASTPGNIEFPLYVFFDRDTAISLMGQMDLSMM